jgi:hypothetical protein
MDSRSTVWRPKGSQKSHIQSTLFIIPAPPFFQQNLLYTLPVFPKLANKITFLHIFSCSLFTSSLQFAESSYFKVSILSSSLGSLTSYSFILTIETYKNRYKWLENWVVVVFVKCVKFLFRSMTSKPFLSTFRMSSELKIMLYISESYDILQYYRFNCLIGFKEVKRVPVVFFIAF